MKIGVLAVQGAFIEHAKMLTDLGVEPVEIRQLNDLTEDLSGIILPGGESTVMGKLLNELGMQEPLKKKIQEGFPVFGTCAGLILLADQIENPTKKQSNLKTMHITVRRNAYGRQLGSFYATADFADEKDVPMTFIRAPYISQAADGVEILSQVDGKIVAAREGNQLVTAFHPELTDDLRVHQYFLENIVRKA